VSNRAASAAFVAAARKETKKSVRSGKNRSAGIALLLYTREDGLAA
jgi:hypothetical protein